MTFDLPATVRKEMWDYLIKELEIFYDNPRNRKVSPTLNVREIKDYINPLIESEELKDAINHILIGLEKYTVHTSHPSYFGLFNPRANFPSILADTITAAFNPQLAAWSHAPFAIEVEAKLIKRFAEKFGYANNESDGVFTTGGAEANLTALLSALNNKYPNYTTDGIRVLKNRPCVYCSSESHHSIIKAVSVAGLGINSVRKIPQNDNFQIQLQELENLIKSDMQAGFEPLMLIVTLGTTGAGIIEPVKECSVIAKQYKMWLHADAAYGGGAILSEEHKYLLSGIELADSITFDAHKWMSVSMSASIFLTKHKEVLNQTFRITADYMPKEAGSLDVTDPFTHSIQWSRRFIGLKVYLSLLMFGWKGYEEIINHHFLMGQLLKKKLKENDWIIFNETHLPIICFGKKYFINDEGIATKICNETISSGKAWLSVYNLNNINALRVCITNYLTNENDLDSLIMLLNSVESNQL
ncbi:MAG: pyridoxal phosphate-dependent decarboxylase family protein [Chitinophagaceae bacterium]